MMSSNPDGMKSIIADKLSSFGDYQDLIPLLDDPAKLGEVTEVFVQRSSEAARSAAAEGKAAKNKNNPSNNSTIINKGPDGGEFTMNRFKTDFVGGLEQDIYVGRDGKRYYRKTNDNEAKWQTAPITSGSGTKPTNTSVVVNNDFADREEEIKQALENGIDPTNVYSDVTPEEINKAKEKINKNKRKK